MSEKAAWAAEVQDPGLRAAVGVGRKARPKIGTEFRGVSRRHGGKFAARIGGSKGQSQTWFGTFDTAEDAARVFDGATAKMRGAAARSNFKQAAGIDDGGVSPPLQVPAEPSGCRDTGTNFRGVLRTRSGKFGARIRQYKGKTHAWLGSFNTAEDAAMAYDAAAVELHGAKAITNFKQPSGHGVHRQPSGVYTAPQICDWKGKAALSLGGFGSLPVHLPPVEWQQVDDFLNDMDSADDREELVEAAAILQHISLAGMQMAGEANQHK
ncbi:unnamed protein product [Alopecurus aequalis]